MIPGELLAEPGDIELNAGRPTITRLGRFARSRAASQVNMPLMT